MTLRDSAIAKLQQLPEPLLQEINNFIDLLIQQRQPPNPQPETPQPQDPLTQAWTAWFEQVDRLEVTSTEPTSDYQKHLLTKFQQQGISL